jgi:hypothetical protein
MIGAFSGFIFVLDLQRKKAQRVLQTVLTMLSYSFLNDLTGLTVDTFNE